MKHIMDPTRQRLSGNYHAASAVMALFILTGGVTEAAVTASPDGQASTTGSAAGDADDLAKKLSNPIDLYNSSLGSTGQFSLGTIELDAKDHTLQVQITGANPKAVKRHMFGLDYIKLEKLD